MKKIFAILAFVAIATTVAAQVPDKENLPIISGTVSEYDKTDQAAAFEQYVFSELLNRENRLLKQRSIATIVTLSGGALATIGFSLRDQNNRISSAGSVIGGLGLAATFGSGIWLIVNEFQLISTRRKINEKTVLRVTPTGVTLHF